MRRRVLVAGIAAVAASTLLVASTGTAGSAVGAAAPTNGSSHSQALYVNGTSKLAVSITNPNGLDTSGLSTLTSDLLQLPLSLTSALGSAVTNLTNSQADNPSTAQPRPAEGSYPASCTSQGWTAGDCYKTLGGPLVVPGVATLNLGGLQGYATADSAGYVAGASTAVTAINLLGLLDLGNLGVTTSLAKCGLGAGATCSPNQTLTGVSLLNNLVTAQLAPSGNTNVLTAQVIKNGTPVTLGATSVPVGSTGINAALSNNLLTLTVPITLTNLLGLFGTGLSGLTAVVLNSLITLLSSLLGTTTVSSTTAINLVVSLGPGQISTAGSTTSASSYGLRLQVGLNAVIGFDVKLLGLLGLAHLTVNANGPLLDIGLAYSNATPGLPVATWIPPGAI